MAGSRFLTLLSLLSLAIFAVAAPSTSTSATSVSACDTTSQDVVPFTIELTWGDFNPTNGVGRKAIHTNGTIPGPALNLKVGQTVEFTVINHLDVVTSVHFHGISQKSTPWADGVPGLTQKPIAAGATYQYKWTADEAGAYFYHAHYKGQMMDGLYGAIIIAPADDAQKPFNLISNNTDDLAALTKAELNTEPVFVSDWVQYTFDEFAQIQRDANIDISCMDAIILNGKGSQYCLSSGDLAAYQAAVPNYARILSGGNLTAKACIPASNAATQGAFTRNLAAVPANAYDKCNPSTGETYTYTVDPADKWASLTFINSGGFALLKLTIDNHKLYVYEVNGNYVVPQAADLINISNGDRYSFFVKLDQQVGTYPIRVANAGLNQLISGFGSLAYKGAVGVSSTAQAVMNFAGGNTTVIKPFADRLAAPYPPVSMSATSDVTYFMELEKVANQSAAWKWTMSGVNPYDMSRDDQSPLLFQDYNSIVTSDTVIKTPVDAWVDMVIITAGPLAQPHPMHKHASKAFVLGQGVGNFTWKSVAEAAAARPTAFNLVNPPYRDGYTTTPAEGNSSWLALRYKADHPGAWLFHCHVQTHLSGGMAVALIEGGAKYPVVPSDAGTVCPVPAGGWSNSTSGTGKGAGSGTGSSTTSSTVASYTGAAASMQVLSSSVVVALFSLLAFALNA